MVDVFDKSMRSFIMSQIKSKDTKPEMILRKELWSKGLRYRIHMKDVCNADIVFFKNKLAIFVDGEFWHGQNWKEFGKVPPEGYWQTKIEKNIKRDIKNTRRLENEGWKVLRFWESKVLNFLDECVREIINSLESEENVD
jgi:DNA mismatch endonuclease, patch repair protein